MLRFIPGTAQDVRNYFLTLQYRIAASDENIANMVRLLVGKYAKGERKGEVLFIDARGIYRQVSRAIRDFLATLPPLPQAG